MPETMFQNFDFEFLLRAEFEISPKDTAEENGNPNPQNICFNFPTCPPLEESILNQHISPVSVRSFSKDGERSGNIKIKKIVERAH